MPNKNFSDYDKFERKDFSERLTKIIKTFSPFYEESFVLSLNAKYGSGKTTFLKMWQKELQADNHEVIYINAWETDFDEEPLIPIISALISEIDERDAKDKKKKVVKNLKKSLQGAMGASALAATQVSKRFTGLDSEEIIKRTKSDFNYGDLEKAGEEIYKEYNYKKQAYTELRTSLETYINTLEHKPLFIFIDELDRVRPNYAIQFLEAIKHIFSIYGICFVIAVDKEQLECATKHIYGDIDFKNYYLRFITREANLPDISGIDLTPFIDMLAHEFFDEKRIKGVTFPFPKEEQQKLVHVINVVCRAHFLTGRQTKTFFRIFSQYMAINSDQTFKFSRRISGIVYLIAMSIYNVDLYHKLGKGEAEASVIENYIDSLDFRYPPHNKNKLYAVLVILSLFIKEWEEENTNKSEHAKIADIVLKYHPRLWINDDRKASREKALDKITQDEFSPYINIGSSSVFEEIYNSLEEWKTFID